MDLHEENAIIGQVINKNELGSVTFPAEVFILLYDKRELLGFYVLLWFFKQFNLISYRSQKELASSMKLSLPTYLEYRDALIKSQLLKVNYFKGRRWDIEFCEISRLPKISQFGNVPQDNYLNDLRSKVLSGNTIEIKEQQKSIVIEGIIEEEAKKKAREMIQKQKEKEKAEEVRFPNEDYDIVMNAYKKYKGVGLIGPEIVRAKRAIKQMFKATRTPKQIIDCMQFFKENQTMEENVWMRSWTLETIMKKIPEFLSGSLSVKKMGDDLEYIKIK